MIRSRRDEITPYITLDGSEIRELLHPDQQPLRNQSLAEAVVPAGASTRRHRHRQSEELYHVTAGCGVMRLGEESFAIAVGDSILIPPGTPHCVTNDGDTPLHLLCCCAPAYAHADTELLD